jgi:hypothetical protein
MDNLIVTCTATAKQTGRRCRRRPSPGHHVCVIHGSRGGRPPTKSAIPRLRARELDRAKDPTNKDLELGLAALDRVADRQDELLEAARAGACPSCGVALSERELLAEVRDTVSKAQKHREALAGIMLSGKYAVPARDVEVMMAEILGAVSESLRGHPELGRRTVELIGRRLGG